MAGRVVFLYCDIIFIDISGINRYGQNSNGLSKELKLIRQVISIIFYSKRRVTLISNDQGYIK